MTNESHSKVSVRIHSILSHEKLDRELAEIKLGLEMMKKVK